jgi:hypothetical protein
MVDLAIARIKASYEIVIGPEASILVVIFRDLSWSYPQTGQTFWRLEPYGFLQTQLTSRLGLQCR